jgi:LruC domain-containing protein
MAIRFGHLGVMLSAVVSTSAIAAEAFQECPSQAFLFQRNPVQVYGVDLLTGKFELLQTDAGMPGNINGVGFSFDDRFLYGFNTTTYDVVRLDRNFKAETLPVSGLPASVTFYVGDVSNSIYWVYRKGVGLYRIDLREESTDYLRAIKIEGAQTDLTLTDFAFHPDDGQLYAVDNRTGVVYRLSTETGQFERLGESGVTGTFGAAYFDVNGFLYIGRNNDGYIFRIDLSDTTSPDVTAELFAQGPSSNQNDGARCAYAPIVSSNVDWGDAPDSYQTSLETNGARHGLSDQLYLGSIVPDGELDAAVYPFEDDTQLYDDEEGLSWTGDWVAGLHQKLEVEVTGTGYLNLWVDWHGDGSFSQAGDQVLQDYAVSSGAYTLPVIVPMDANAGSTWLRARLSSSPGIEAYGGAVEGEVEDHPLTILRRPISQRYFPSANGWATLAFEDQWPEQGDFDFNDVVLRYRLTETLQNTTLKRVDIAVQIQALGATYQSGFAVQFSGLTASPFLTDEVFRINEQGREFDPDIVPGSGIVAVLSENLKEDVNAGCFFYRTVSNCSTAAVNQITISLPVNSESGVNFPSFPYNPFIFGAESIWRGATLAQIQKESVEIHLADHAPSSQAAQGIWGLGADDSNPELQRYYRTENHLPWSLLLNDQWQHPKEGVSILQAYPQLRLWAESNGLEAQDWYLIENANTQELYEDE